MAILDIKLEDFTKETGKQGVTVVEFYSDTCAVCKILLPELEEVAAKNQRVRFYKINAQTCRQLCLTYRILSLPTTIVFKNGEFTEKFTGYKSAAEMKVIVEKLS